MGLIELLRDPIFGMFSTFVAGLITSHFYYRKSKREADKSARESKLQLDKAEVKIVSLNAKLEEANRSLDSLIEYAKKNIIGTEDIFDIMKSRTYGAIQNDTEVLTQFLILIREGKALTAENFLMSHVHNLKNDFCRTYMQAHLKLFHKNYEEALVLFDVSSYTSDNWIKFESFLNAGNICHRYLINMEQALIYFIKANSIEPSNTDSLNAIAAIYLNLGEFTKAKEKLDASLDYDSLNPNTNSYLAMFYLWTNNYDNAIEYCKKALESGANQIQILPLYADAFLAKKDYPNAIENYENAIKLQQDNPLLLSNLIAAYIESNDILSAERACHIYMRRFPSEFSELFNNYSIILCKQGKYQEVIQLSKKFDFMSDISRYSHALRSIGVAYFNLTQLAKGKEYFEAVLLVHPLEKTALDAMGTYYILSEEKDLNKSLEYFEFIYYKIDRYDIHVLSSMANLFLIKGEHKKAFDFANQVLKLDENNLEGRRIRDASSVFLS